VAARPESSLTMQTNMLRRKVARSRTTIDRGTSGMCRDRFIGNNIQRLFRQSNFPWVKPELKDPTGVQADSGDVPKFRAPAP
jgi:hypothetical protein